MTINTQSNFLKNLKIWGFKINPFNKTITGIKDLILNHKKSRGKKKRNKV